MQSLYSYFSKKEDDIELSVKSMSVHINQVQDLYYLVFSLLIEIIKYSDRFLENAKKKHIPSIVDLNPNKRFSKNNYTLQLLNNDILLEKTNSLLHVWIDNDHDIISKLFKKIYRSSIYSLYIQNQDQDLSIDQKFIINVLNDYVLNDELTHHILEEHSIYWLDDLPFVTAIIIYNIKSNIIVCPPSVFKDNTDKYFTLDLFRKTIVNNKFYEDIIVNIAENWDLDRIALMDKILLKMAFTEILNMKDLPVKVSMNEYIEISKYYSTKKSKSFVNGILDKAVKQFYRDERIK